MRDMQSLSLTDGSRILDIIFTAVFTANDCWRLFALSAKNADNVFPYIGHSYIDFMT